MKDKEPRTRFHIHNNYRDSGKFTILRFFALIAGLVFCVIVILDFIFKPAPKDILIEFHGLFFDLLVFGIVLTIYDTWNKRREHINTLHDQLDDFWDWKSEEGILRKVGIIKRLIELNHPIPRMTAIYLSGADFFNVEFNRLLLQNSTLENSKFNYSKLYDSFFSSSNFRSSHFEHCNFNKSTIAASDFENASLKFCGFENSTVRGNVNFRNANLHGAVFVNTAFEPEAFGYPDFTDSDLSMANLCGADLTHCRGLTNAQVKSAQIDEKTKLPDYL